VSRNLTISYRALLLASVAGTAIGGVAQGQTVTNNSVLSSPTASFILSNGLDAQPPGTTSLINNPSGSIMLSSSATPGNAAVLASTGPISNNGIISAQGARGIGVHVTSGGSVGTITNGHAISATADGGSAIVVDGAANVGTLANTGTIQALGNPSAGTIASAISIAPTSSITAITNSGSAVIQAIGSAGVAVNIGGGLGTLTNAGTISSSGANGIAVNVAAVGTLGSLINTGGIFATGTSAVAVDVFGAVGSITNSGTIQGSADANSTSGAVRIEGGASVTSITNNAGGTISSATQGGAIDVAGNLGTLTNNGLLSTSGGNANDAVFVEGSGVVASLNNGPMGTILANTPAGYAVEVAGSVTSGSNSGLIQSTGNGGYGVYVDSGIVNTYTNAVGGIISATGTGFAIANTVGTLVNNGTITSPTDTGLAILGGTLTSFVNSGLVSAGGPDGIAINVSSGAITSLSNLTGGTIIGGGTAIAIGGTVGSIVNASTIISATGTAISIGAGGVVANGITNSAGGLISGTVAIDNSANSTPLAITNAGSIHGAILFGTGGDSLNITGGAITGNIVGQSGSGGSITLTLGAGGSFTNANTISGIDLFLVNSGTLVNSGSVLNGVTLAGTSVLNLTGSGTVAGAITGLAPTTTLNFNTTGTYALANPIVSVGTVNVNAGALLSLGAIATSVSGALSFNVASLATVNWNGGTIGATTFTNSGLLNVGSTTATLNGSYSQTSSGQLELTILNTATHGLLTMSGPASVVGTPGGIIVNVPTSAALGLVGQTITVATSTTSLTVSQASSLTATSTDPYIFFNVSEVGNNIVLTGTNSLGTVLGIVGGPSDTGATDGLSSTGLQNAQNVRVALNGLLTHLASIGDTADYDHIVATILSLSPTGQAQLLRQLEPNLILNSEALLNAALAVNGGATTSINDRLIAARATSGMAAGDEVGRGFVAWAQPYGSFETQDGTQGVDGFKVNSYGAAFGLDTMVRSDLRLGMAFGFGSSDIQYSGNLAGNSASVWNAQLAAYGTWFQNGFFVDAVLGGGLNWYSTHENQTALGYTRTGNFNGTQLNAKLGVGYDWAAPNGIIVTPGLSFQETHISMDGYTTSGASVLNLHVNSASADILQSRVGARVAYPMTGYGTYTLTPEIHAYYLHNFGSDQTTMTSYFTGGGPGFSTTSPARDRNIYNIGLGLTVAQVGPMALSGVYDYAGGATSHEHMFFIRFKTEF
jgi:outer membrane autotransporter protein